MFMYLLAAAVIVGIVTLRTARGKTVVRDHLMARRFKAFLKGQKL
jgi:hypothetical protein